MEDANRGLETKESDLARSIKKINSMQSSINQKEAETGLKQKMIQHLQGRILEVENQMRQRESFKVSVGVQAEPETWQIATQTGKRGGRTKSRRGSAHSRRGSARPSLKGGN